VVSKLHRERFEQVRKLAEALESYASHFEPTFVKIKVPPTAPNATISPSFDISPSYVASLDNEFTRVYEEYTRRINLVKSLCHEMIQLWAELGTPQAQTDTSVVKYGRDAPEQLGLHQDDLARLKAKRDRLVEEKRSRERRLKELRGAIETLWDRLGIDEQEQKQFLSRNRGCGLRTINEYEEELDRLNELKRQNLSLFVDEARIRLQELWDSLYFSEDEMMSFTPAFSEVHTDALLSAHEAEIARLEALKEQRLPTLQKIDRYRELIKERDDLQASSQDASRLMLRGNKGEKRDPGKLLREEKMRKRIAKELPKVEAELKKVLEKYENEYGRPFLVHGERYLDELYSSAAKGPPPRPKTPNALAPPAKPVKGGQAPVNRGAHSRGASTVRAKTPVSNFGASINRNPLASSMSAASGAKSPSKIPARAPLRNMPHGNNSPERQQPVRTEREESAYRKMPPPRAPPPRMKALDTSPEPIETPSNRYEYTRERTGSIIRQVQPEDPYDDRSYMARSVRQAYPPQYTQQPQYAPQYSSDTSGSRQTSGASSAGTGITVPGSENWETYSEQSEEPERDSSNYYFHPPAAAAPPARNKRYTPEGGYGSPRAAAGKKVRSGIRGVETEYLADGTNGQLVKVSGSEAGWTDEDGY
jgi:protein regulator of cytokinesis 1